jgi:hypothetical protein
MLLFVIFRFRLDRQLEAMADRHNNQSNALITAAINAISPAIKENALINPPRTVGDRESATPISPDTIATTASTKPQNAPGRVRFPYALPTRHTHLP